MMTILELDFLARYSVVDPHHVDTEPDLTYHHDADSDSDFYLLLIRIQIFIESVSDFAS
jgi:hypothetical protein